MANKSLFSTHTQAPETDAVNEAGGRAYSRGPKELLAQYAVTGCFGDTYYVSAKGQLDTVKSTLAHVDDMFIAKLAIYAREKGLMKDMPAFLAASLSLGKAPRDLADKVFDRVIDNAKMLRNFAQFVRSGVFGRKSLASSQRRSIQRWFDRTRPETIFRGSVGNDPSLVDVIRLAHPSPNTPQKEALFGYLLGFDPVGPDGWKERVEPAATGKKVTRRYEPDKLPEMVKEYENWKTAHKAGVKDVTIPDVPFQMLDGVGIGEAEWKILARNGRWQFTRMNLNNFLKYGVLGNAELRQKVENRLQNREEITKARQFPYQLLTAYLNLNPEIPQSVQAALEQAMEVAIENVPAIEGRVFVFPDISGSMHSPVTQSRGPRGHSTKTSCVHVAALMAAAILRKNPEAQVIPFSDHLALPGRRVQQRAYYFGNQTTMSEYPRLNPRDTVMTNARILSELPSGGTNCSLTVNHLNDNNIPADTVILVSDYESWIDSTHPYGGRRGTELQKAWQRFKRHNKQAKLVCLDITPYSTTQVKGAGDPSILQVGGFSDTVFDVVSMFAKDGLSPAKWVGEIEAVEV